MLRCPVPMVVTLHDLAPLKRHGQYLRSTLRFKLRYLAVQRAARVIVPDLRGGRGRRGGARDPPRAHRGDPRGPGARRSIARSEAEVSAVRDRFALPERYLVWVGAMQRPDPRKRVAALTRAARSMPLVLVGPTAQWAHELPGVTLTGAVSDDELAAIYTGAHALVFPSRRRGLRAAPDRGARVRDAGRRVRRPRPARGAGRARHAQRRSTTSTASSPRPNRPSGPPRRRRPGRGRTRRRPRGRSTARRSPRPARARSPDRNIGPPRWLKTRDVVSPTHRCAQRPRRFSLRSRSSFRRSPHAAPGAGSGPGRPRHRAPGSVRPGRRAHAGAGRSSPPPSRRGRKPKRKPKPQKTVSSELTRLLKAQAITSSEYATYNGAWNAALNTQRHLHGTPRHRARGGDREHARHRRGRQAHARAGCRCCS